MSYITANPQQGILYVESHMQLYSTAIPAGRTEHTTGTRHLTCSQEKLPKLTPAHDDPTANGCHELNARRLRQSTDFFLVIQYEYFNQGSRHNHLKQQVHTYKTIHLIHVQVYLDIYLSNFIACMCMHIVPINAITQIDFTPKCECMNQGPSSIEYRCNNS